MTKLDEIDHAAAAAGRAPPPSAPGDARPALNVIPFQQFSLESSSPRQQACKHARVKASRPRRILTCMDCEQSIEAFDWVEMLAEREIFLSNRWHKLERDITRKAAELAELEALIQAARIMNKGLSMPFVEPDVAHDSLDDPGEAPGQGASAGQGGLPRQGAGSS